MDSRKSYIINLVTSLIIFCTFMVYVIINQKELKQEVLDIIVIGAIWLITFIWGIKVYRILRERKREKSNYVEKKVRTYYYSSNPNNNIVYILILIFKPFIKLGFKFIIISILGFVTTPFMLILAIYKSIRG